MNRPTVHLDLGCAADDCPECSDLDLATGLSEWIDEQESLSDEMDARMADLEWNKQ